MNELDDWILIVDDDEDIRDMLGMILDASDYRTRAASDGQEALDILSRGAAPGLILLDLMMPGIHGAALAEALKSMPALRDVPIVILSGDTAASETAPSLGAASCLVKPVDLEQLLDTVRRYFAPRHRRPGDGPAVEEQPAEV